ncbi:hypothetical protein E1A91_D03G164600v1 [Gossypium mustelinum]|uniref:Uncharacterized protein n=1 Tax=Gossypium mustelinum TaxID=34275 RepID=A0A5D2VQ60_GOSMU|nr:hypothetical protein E1A91_D03G164600v1 [Gossypium mustelinum]
MLLEISVDQKQLASIIFSFPITDPAINSSKFPQIFLPFATPSNSHLFALNLNILDSSSPLLVGWYLESPQPVAMLVWIIDFETKISPPSPRTINPEADLAFC